MKNWKNKLKIRTILLAVALLAATAIGATFAWQTWSLEMTNVLTAHETQISIVENFEPTVGTKIVRFKNEGTSSVFLRVSYTEFWEIEGREGIDGVESTGPIGGIPSTILPNTVYDQRDGNSVGSKIAKKYCNEKEWVPRNDQEWVDNEDWMDGGDGWFYYKKVLKAGNNTSCECNTDKKSGKDNANIASECDCECCTGEVLTKVLFDNELLNAHEEYKDAHYQLYFKAEVVQCSDGSNTLNSDEVNEDATRKLFGKVARVSADGITVTWK